MDLSLIIIMVCIPTLFALLWYMKKYDGKEEKTPDMTRDSLETMLTEREEARGRLSKIKWEAEPIRRKPNLLLEAAERALRDK